MLETELGAGVSTPEPGVDNPATDPALDPNPAGVATDPATSPDPAVPGSDSQPTEELYTIKVQGQEKQVTRDELITLAQMGDD